MRSKKNLGQNFLVDEAVAERIVQALRLEDQDTVLEIGAGKGALTKHLLDKVKKVYAVEIDRRLCAYLQQRFGQARNLKIVNGDILKIDLSQLLGWAGGCKVVGNLPYQITSPVLSLLLENRQLITLCVVTVQKEVASRICASPGTRDWSPLSVAVQIYSDAQILFHLKPASFVPPPKVGSAVIRIALLRSPRISVSDQTVFFHVVRSAFGQRRKMLSNSLASNLNLRKKQIEVILKQAGIDPRRRAETLSLEEFSTLASVIGDVLPDRDSG